MRRFLAATVGLTSMALSAAVPAQTVISVDATANRHAINPQIYGTSNLSTAQLIDLNSPLVRYGGNSSSTYNWLLNGDNRGNDWFFESWGDASAIAGERGDTFIANAKAANAVGMISIPLLPYVAKLGADRATLWSYSTSKYGAQTGNDPWNGGAGNGISTAAGHPFINNDPLDASTPSSAATQLDWIKHLISRWGKASAGGVKYYVMDNEPAIWHSTHRDVHPNGETMDELYNDYVSYAGNVRAQDPGALIVGPEEFGWTGYLYSGSDMQWAGTHGWGGPFPDRTAHNNMDHVAWLLKALHQYQVNTGKQLLNVFSLHWYPQQGEYSNDDSAAMRTIRNRSTRSLWDPTYTDTSWVGDIVKLIPRMKSWVSTYYPGLPTAVTEYSWGDEANLNGATAQADVLGIFGRESLDMASRWGTPDTGNPTYLAMKIYRNYDGKKSGFGTTSCLCSVPNPDNLSAFASQRADGTTTVMVVNKVGTSAPIQVQIAHQGVANWASAWQISTTAQTSITRLANAVVNNGILSTTVPPQSVTLFVVPKGPYTLSSQFDFESGLQGWTSSAAPITGLVWSGNQVFSGVKGAAVKFSGAAGTAQAYVSAPGTPAGSTVTFHVWIPASNKISAIQPYVQQGAAGGWLWTGNYQPIGSLQTNAWNTITVTVPAGAVTPLYQVGVQFTTSAAWTGNCYIDAISW